jgi:hypothetical protein
MLSLAVIFTLILYYRDFSIKPTNDTATLATYLDSKNEYFLTFLKSISSPSHRNLTFVLFVNEKFPSRLRDVLPSNVLVHRVSWKHVVSRLERFLDRNLSHIHRTTNYYKSIDFKPLIPALYPQIFRDSSCFGWLDSDVWASSNLLLQLASACTGAGTIPRLCSLVGSAGLHQHSSI